MRSAKVMILRIGLIYRGGFIYRKSLFDNGDHIIVKRTSIKDNYSEQEN